MKRDATVPVRAPQRPSTENRVVAKVQAAGSQDIGGGHARAMAKKYREAWMGNEFVGILWMGWGGGVA